MLSGAQPLGGLFRWSRLHPRNSKHRGCFHFAQQPFRQLAKPCRQNSDERYNCEVVKVGGKHFRTIWRKPDDERAVQLIDQRFLPHDFVIEEIRTVEQMATAIREMHVRGAGLIGASAGYGMYLAALEAARQDSFDEHMTGAAAQLMATRPTAVNLSWAIERQLQNIAAGKTADEKVALALRTADSIADEDAEHCRMIGQHGLALIQQIAETKGNKPVNVLTHCNAGWLAFVDYGSATAPIYAGHERGLPLHVWVTETRPRNQGSKLTAWELGQHGVPHTVIADSAAGHLMQRGEVDLVIVGTDRTTYTGRCGKQDRYISEGVGRESQRRSVLRCAAFVLDRLENARRIEGNSDRTTWRGRSKKRRWLV